MKIRARFKKQISTNEGRAKLGALAVLAGLLLEVALAFKFRTHKSFLEEWGPLIADALIAIGVYVEIHFGRKASNESAERVAEATARAAEADRKRVELEVKLQPRSLNEEQWDLIQGLRGKLTSVGIAFETDAETCWFAGQIKDAFCSAGISVDIYRRAAEVHSFGILIYEPRGFDGSRPRTTEPLVEIFRKSDGQHIAFSLAVIANIPSDIQAPDDIPMIIVGGRFVLPPPHMVFPRPDTDHDNASINPQNTSRESNI
jgi:hypothetical protein